MKAEAQRIAIAEAGGWKPRIEIDPKFNLWMHPDGTHECTMRLLPDYLNDLNAMHEAEKVLTATQWPVYRNTLAMLCGAIREDDGGIFVEAGLAINATAAQRAEAFLRTVGKWTE